MIDITSDSSTLPVATTLQRVMVVMPTYNEAGNIGPLSEQIIAADPRVDIVVVDDSSPDGTAALAQAVAAQHPTRMFVEVRSERNGRGGAVEHGLRFATTRGYEFALEMDADFSHDPHEIPQLINATKDADLVIASRHLPGGGVEGWNWKRKLIHWAASVYADMILGRHTTDHTNGFRIYRLSVLAQLPAQMRTAQGFAGQTLRAYYIENHGGRIHDVPSMFRERRLGHSKMSLGEAINGAWLMFTTRLRGV